ncbi:hypothetical protein CHH55_16985 [Niallia circulans]|jgi:phage minor structural protein|uniref:phage tail protein n=1 Tax=Niallia circulans TaxID=1397 RepID=UPI000BA5D0C3|nr:phage tail protein [Niallia circulans]PAD86665.1 hypothetical protein CHH55_16985 [Niallia circulans]
MLTVKNLQLEQVGVLENAYGLSYEKKRNEIWNASFSLPLNDIKNKYCNLLHFIEVVDEYIDDDGIERSDYIGLFRIVPKRTVKNESNKEITYALEHVLATLLDKMIFGYRQTTNITTRENLQYLIDQQEINHWKLGTVAFTRYFSYKWENSNLLSCIFSIPQPFDVDYQWTWDTQSYPWTLNLVEPETKPTGEIREKYNLLGIELEEDPRSIFNRIYPLGYGEGDNQLTIKSVNNGIPYVEDEASIKEYGPREYIWADKRFEDATSLKASTLGLLKEWKRPKASWSISAAELSRLTGLPKDKFRLGKVVRIIDEDFPKIELRINKESKEDVKGQPWNVQLELGDLKADLATTQADTERRQQINELYAQGATNISNYSYNDNADSENPAEILVYVPDEIVRLNKAILSYKTDKFRAYERAIKGGGAVVDTTSSGGGTTATSSSGGGVSKSTASGGGTVESSSAGGDHNHLILKQVDITGPVQPTRYQGAAGGGVIEVNGSGGDIYTAGSSGNHTHSVPVPNHTHEFNIPNHTHDVIIPNHVHKITLPNHTHAIEFGIFKLDELPSKVTISVDGNTLPNTSLNGDNINLIPYLSKDSSGKVNRGWHTIAITPNDLGRINAQIYTQFFIQSRGEGEY